MSGVPSRRHELGEHHPDEFLVVVDPETRARGTTPRIRSGTSEWRPVVSIHDHGTCVSETDPLGEEGLHAAQGIIAEFRREVLLLRLLRPNLVNPLR